MGDVTELRVAPSQYFAIESWSLSIEQIVAPIEWLIRRDHGLIVESERRFVDNDRTKFDNFLKRIIRTFFVLDCSSQINDFRR